MTNERAIVGAAGEAIAARALARAGWQILARNLRVGGLEIDILARDESGRLVAVEVRARRSLGEASPAEILGRRKLAALRRQRGAMGDLARVDLMLVIGQVQTRRLRLVRGVAEGRTAWKEEC